MLRNEVRTGMVVVFGRDRGEQTLGKVIKCNPTKAKVQTLESRGSDWKRGGNDAGQIWGVPYSLMRQATQAEIDSLGEDVTKKLPVSAFRIPEPLKYNEFDPKNGILELIAGCYNQLSPENLHCDGEISRSAAAARAVEINRQLKGLFIAYGRTVSEGEIFQWVMSKREAKRVA